MSKITKLAKPIAKEHVNETPKWMGLPREFKLLIEMYRTLAPSNHEEGMVKIVLRELNAIGIPYNVDEQFNIYRLKPNTPLICAHMDQVGRTQIDCIFTDGKMISGTHNLGADDKNGIFICLKLLKEFRQNVSFLFTTGEESGGNCQELIKRKAKTLAKIKYGLVFDRKGGSDFIGYANDYCTLEFQKVLTKLAHKKGHPHRACKGVFSDADRLNDHMSCVNISCGYQKAHTSDEYTIIDDLIAGYDFGRDILKHVTNHYDKFIPPPTVHQTYGCYKGTRGARRNGVFTTDKPVRDAALTASKIRRDQYFPKAPVGVQQNLPTVAPTTGDKEEHSRSPYGWQDGERATNLLCPSCYGERNEYDIYTDDFICRDCLKLHQYFELLTWDEVWSVINRETPYNNQL